MKPDLGLQRLQQGYTPTLAHFFYGVEVVDIDFISPDLHSIMFEFPEGGTSYAISFDFDSQLAAQIFEKLSSTERNLFLATINGRNFPFRATLPRPILLESVESYLGEVQRGAHDSFVPFVIKRIQ